MRRRNPNTRRGHGGVDGIRTCSKFDAGAGPREDYPLSGPKSSNELESDGWPARLSVASAGADRMRGRLRYRTANAERENEPREESQALHHAQLTTALSCHGQRAHLCDFGSESQMRQNFRQLGSSKQWAIWRRNVDITEPRKV